MLTPIAPAHLTRITEIHSRAFPDSALNLLGNEAVRRYYAWQLLGPHDAVAVAVESDGALLGYCFGGVFRGSLSGFMKRNAFHLFWALLKRPSIWIAPAIRGRVRKGLKALLRPQRAASVARTPGRPPRTITDALCRCTCSPASPQVTLTSSACKKRSHRKSGKC